MDARTKSSILWGVVGLLSFLVMIQGYELISGTGVDWAVKGVVAVLVGVAATGVSYRSQPRLLGSESP